MGNCWLIAALGVPPSTWASPAGVRDKIRPIAAEYVVRLFDWQKQTVTVSVDESIPLTSKDRQMPFAQPNGR